MNDKENITRLVSTGLRARDYESFIANYEKRANSAMDGVAENELLRDKVNDRLHKNLVLLCAVLLAFLFFGLFVFILVWHFEELILGLHKSQFMLIPISMLAVLPVILMIAVVNKVFTSSKKDEQKFDSEQNDIDMKSCFTLLQEVITTLKELVVSLKGG